MKPVQPSDTLAEVVGSKAIPRTEVTKKLWAYIKKNGLQDKKNKRMIKADDNAEGRVRRQGDGQHVRDDEAGQQAPQVSTHGMTRLLGTPGASLRISHAPRPRPRTPHRDVNSSPSYEPTPLSSRALPAVHRQRLRRADLRDRLVPAAAAGHRLVGDLARHPARHVHGRHVPRQPAAAADDLRARSIRCASTRRSSSASACSAC